MVQCPGDEAAAQRARWLAELSEALDAALRLLMGLGVTATDHRHAIELYLRIERARQAVQSLRMRRGSGPGELSDPKWTGSVPWQLGQDNPA